MSTAVTTHGSQYSYDQRVPVIFFGASVRAGRYTGAATPADLMPTLAAVAKVKIAKTDGRVLTRRAPLQEVRRLSCHVRVGSHDGGLPGARPAPRPCARVRCRYG